MSWQRILRFAKQRQVPVIITDESGEEPLILLSLDQLEQALDGNAAPDLPPPPPAPRPTTPSFVPEPEPEPALEPEASLEPGLAVEPIPEPVPFAAPEPTAPEASVAEPSKEPAKEPEIITPPLPEPANPLVHLPAIESTPASSLSLEERFFLDL